MLTLSTPNPVRLNALAFSPAGDRIAACGDSGAVRVWDLTTGKLILSTRCGSRSGDAIFYAGDPESLFVLTRPQRLVAREVAGKKWREITKPDTVKFVVPLPDGRVFCYLPEAESVGLSTLPTLTHVWTREIHGKRNALPSSPAAIASAPGGRVVGCVFDTGEVGLLDAETGETRHLYPTGAKSIGQLAIAPDGSAFAVLALSHLYFRRTSPDAEPKHYQIGLTHFMAVAWHTSAGFFATVKGDGTVDYWDGLDGERRQSLDWNTGKLLDIAFDSTGDRAAACSEKGEVVVWDVDR